MFSTKKFIETLKVLTPAFLSIILFCCKNAVNRHDIIGNFQIFQGDYRNMYPYIEEAQVTSEELAIICLIPLFLGVIIFIYGIVNVYLNQKNIIFCCNKYTISFSSSETVFSILLKTFFIVSFMYLCLSSTMLFTEVIKSVVAMPRPNFMGMCDYKQFHSNYTYYLENVVPGEIVNLDDCYANSHDIQDSISTFPSGHSSYTMSIACSVFGLFYILGHKISHVLSFGLFFLAFYVGISRIMDYYHNVWDVLFGYFLAILVNVITFSFLVSSKNYVFALIEECADLKSLQPEFVSGEESL